MPTYLYEIQLPNNQKQQKEIKQSIHDEALTEIDGYPAHRIPCLPYVIIDSQQPKTIGGIAAKNTEKMIKNGDPKVKPSRKKTKPKDFSGKSKKQIERYIFEGKI